MILASIYSLREKLTYFIFLFLVMLSSIGYSHSMGESYVFMNVTENSVQGRFELTCNDLNAALQLNDSTGLITADNYEQYLADIQAYVKNNISFSNNGTTLPIRFTKHEVRMIEKLSNFVLLDFSLMEGLDSPPEGLDIEWNFLFDQNDKHRGLLVIEHFWRANLFENERVVSLIFDADERRQRLDLTKFSIWTGFVGVVKLGIKHIFEGIDHILFLVALILPAVLYREEKDWFAVPAFKPALINVVKIVTLFTVAHSITLSIASLGWLSMPSWLVESIIAASIAIAALDNLIPIFGKRMWMVVFGFGLFHGFGFASVLGDLGILGEHKLLTLFGFNLGVELGQVAIICAIFPVLYLLRKLSIYNPVFLKLGSVGLIIMALIWFAERAFDFSF
ncbi:MAG: HupE/UreJ family protein [Calditrichia bacterium]